MGRNNRLKQLGQRLLCHLYFQLLELVPGNELYQIMNIKALFQTRRESASTNKNFTSI